tara:strand:- start:1018 stop:2949 length:1932 start_codon:yes stop_codon:yes gene_type:complete
MAYNIIKGRVEFSKSATGSIESMVDDWRNQTIGGVKTFSSTVSASAFWDTTAEGEVKALKSLIAGDGADRVITSDGDGTLTAESNVTITTAASATSLGVTGHITGSTFSGSAHGLTGIILNPDHLAAINYDGLANRLSASNIVLGVGVAGTTELQVTGGQGITVDTEGVRVLTASNGGLAFTGLTLQVDASKTTNKGGGPSNNDEFIIADSGDSDSIKNLTYSQIKTAITDSISTPAITSYTNNGNNRIITSVNSTTVNAESTLTYDGNTLAVSGTANSTLPSLSISGAADMPLLYVDGANQRIGVNNDNPGTTIQITEIGSAPVLGLHRSASVYYTDGDDLGDVAFAGSVLGGTVSLTSRIRAEADGSVWTPINSPSRLSFWTTNTGSNTATQKMVINNSGNVGIGVAVPSAKLEIAGTLTANGKVSGSAHAHFDTLSLGEDVGSSADKAAFQMQALNDNLVLMVKSLSNETILAATGSNGGQVAVGGGYLAGKFNVSGSDDDKLITAKSNTLNPAFYVSGSGDMFVGRSAYLSGSVRHNYVQKSVVDGMPISGTMDRVVIYNLSSPGNAHLPELTDALNGLTLTVKSVGSSAVTVTGSTNTEQFLDGQANKVLQQGDAITLMGYNGVSGYEWAIINYYDAS